MPASPTRLVVPGGALSSSPSLQSVARPWARHAASEQGHALEHLPRGAPGERDANSQPEAACGGEAARHSRRTCGRLPPTRRSAPRCRSAVPTGRDQPRRAASGRGRVNPAGCLRPIARQRSPRGCGRRAPTDRWRTFRWGTNDDGVRTEQAHPNPP